MAPFSPEAEHLVQQGVQAARAGQNETARRLLHEAVRLAPEHEQAWLWLSGVEATTDAKTAALKQVLAINPANAAAKRGLERLQPSDLDLSAVVSSYAAPAPARAAQSQTPPPARMATRPLGESAAPAATTDQQAAAPARPVALDSLEQLRPAIKHAQNKHPFLPRTSEVVILLLLVVMVAGGYTFFRSYLDQVTFGFDAANTQAQVDRFQGTSIPTVMAQPTEQPAQAAANTTEIPANEPTSVPAANTYRSASYSLQMQAYTVDQEARNVTINVVLSNPHNRNLEFRAQDFNLRNAVNSQLTFSQGESSLFGAGATIPAGGTVEGSLIFVGDIFRAPFTLTWRPTNGNLSQSIVLR